MEILNVLLTVELVTESKESALYHQYIQNIYVPNFDVLLPDIKMMLTLHSAR